MNQRQAVLLLEADLPRADCGNGETTTRLVNRSYSPQSMINGITTIPPRGVIPLHYHNCEESSPVLSGKGITVFGEIELAVKKGDDTWTPNNLSHRFRNGLDTDSMRFFWSYSLAEANRTVAEASETYLIDAEHKE